MAKIGFEDVRKLDRMDEAEDILERCKKEID